MRGDLVLAVLCVALGVLGAEGAHADPNIALHVTVDLSAGNPDVQLCGAEESIAVTPGTEVALCYEVENTGDVTLSVHDLTDSVLGVALADFHYDLVPGASVFLFQYDAPTETAVYTATWTASDLSGAVSASDVDSVFVLVPEPDVAGCGSGAVAALAGVAARRWSRRALSQRRSTIRSSR